MLHATVKPEDECPIQRLDYDRTNLLKTHSPEAEFVNRKVFQNVILGVKYSVKSKSICVRSRPFKSEKISALTRVPPWLVPSVICVLFAIHYLRLK